MSAIGFLKSVLGDDGATALQKANKRVPSLGSVLVPRAILSWLTTAIRISYEGEIPGLDNSYIALQKSEEGFSGALTIGDSVHTFEDSDTLHVAAAIGVALGIDDSGIDPLLKNTDLTKIGQSIDLLVKARVLSKAAVGELEKRVLDPSHGITFHHEHHDLGGVGDLTHIKAIHPSGHVVGEVMFEHQADGSLKPADVTVHPDHRRMGIASALYAHGQKVTGKKVAPSTAQTDMGQALWAGNAKAPQFGKGEHAMAAAPKGPKEPEAPAAPVPTTRATALKPKLPVLKTELPVKKSEAEHGCPECGGRQFKQDKFVGCMCFRALAKSVSTKTTADGYVLSLSRSDWDEETLQSLIGALKR